ncbi:MAG: ATP-binding protein [Candidatus Micrarchaeota archaeon]
MKETLKKIIAEGWAPRPDCIMRHKVPAELALKKPSIVITGPRRAGKSYAAYEMQGLIGENGVRGRNFAYINFEDERLEGFRKENFDEIIEAYHEMREEKPALFLDEIHNVAGWEQFVRRLADAGYKVVVTGSNSRMLSREIAQKLGGRFTEIRVFPLDFREFLKFRGMDFQKEHFYSQEKFTAIKHFGEYFEYGGFPEVALLFGADSNNRLLQTYVDRVFYKDLVGKKKLENEAALKFAIKKIRECIGKAVSPSAIYSAAKSAGIEAGPNTFEKYVDYLEEALLTVPCLPFAKSVRKQERKKRYFVDNGYIKLLEVKEDKSIQLENLVFMELAKKGRAAAFHQGKKECDFIIDGKQAVQATYELHLGNEEREIGGLLEAMAAYGIKKGTIVTFGQEKEMQREGKKISVVPAWKWCLQI